MDVRPDSGALLLAMDAHPALHPEMRTSEIQLRRLRASRDSMSSPSKWAAVRRSHAGSILSSALMLTTAYTWSSISLVTSGTVPQREQTRKVAVPVPKAYFDTSDASRSVTASVDLGLDVQTPTVPRAEGAVACPRRYLRRVAIPLELERDVRAVTLAMEKHRNLRRDRHRVAQVTPASLGFSAQRPAQATQAKRRPRFPSSGSAPALGRQNEAADDSAPVDGRRVIPDSVCCSIEVTNSVLASEYRSRDSAVVPTWVRRPGFA